MHTHDYKNGNVLVYADGNDTAIISQPHWPDGTPWANATEAMAWGQAFANQLDDEDAPLAGQKPSQPTRPRPTANEIEAANKNQPIVLTLSELEALIASKVAEAMSN